MTCVTNTIKAWAALVCQIYPLADRNFGPLVFQFHPLGQGTFAPLFQIGTACRQIVYYDGLLQVLLKAIQLTNTLVVSPQAVGAVIVFLHWLEMHRECRHQPLKSSLLWSLLFFIMGHLHVSDDG